MPLVVIVLCAKSRRPFSIMRQRNMGSPPHPQHAAQPVPVPNAPQLGEDAVGLHLPVEHIRIPFPKNEAVFALQIAAVGDVHHRARIRGAVAPSSGGALRATWGPSRESHRG